MSTSKPGNIAESRKGEPSGVEGLTDVMDEVVSAQILQSLARLERALSSMEDRFGGRLDEIEARLSGQRGSKKTTTDKPSIRNTLLAILQKGWTSETEILEKTGWQTIGVRSFVTKLKSLGVSVDTEERDGVPYYRIAK